MQNKAHKIILFYPYMVLSKFYLSVITTLYQYYFTVCFL